MAAKRRMTHSPKPRSPRPPKDYPVPESNRKLMRELEAGLERAQAWKLANHDRPFSDYLRGAK